MSEHTACAGFAHRHTARTGGEPDAIARGGEFVRRRVEAGEVAFIEMWNSMGGQERFDRRRQWWSDNYQDFADALH